MIEKLRQAAVARLRDRLVAGVAERRAPDIVIGGEADPYLRRWWVVPRNRGANAYLHHFLRSDDDRALHDHRWVNCSILLEGQYTEVVATRGGTTARVLRHAGDVVLRGPRSAHRVELHPGPDGRPLPVWTLFLTGPRVREWGFWCADAGWVHWRDFTAGPRGELVGRGCDQPPPEAGR